MNERLALVEKNWVSRLPYWSKRDNESRKQKMGRIERRILFVILQVVCVAAWMPGGAVIKVVCSLAWGFLMTRATSGNSFKLTDEIISGFVNEDISQR